jgi:hypothetical protein
LIEVAGPNQIGSRENTTKTHMKLQIKPSLKTVILSASLVGMLTAANAADITWLTPTTISGTFDVNTLGTTVGTWGPGDDWEPGQPGRRSDYYPVNGVTFAAYGSGPFGSFLSTSGLNDRYDSYASPGTADPNYNLILRTAIYSYDGNMSLTWGGMTAGNTYLLQFWVQDGRNSVTGVRSETLTGGANTSAALDYGTGDGTGPGQYIIGTFVADGSGQQTLTMQAFGGQSDPNDSGTAIGPSAQINLLQLRDITAVPEPSTLALFAAGGGLILCAYRRKFSVN